MKKKMINNKFKAIIFLSLTVLTTLFLFTNFVNAQEEALNPVKEGDFLLTKPGPEFFSYEDKFTYLIDTNDPLNNTVHLSFDIELNSSQLVSWLDLSFFSESFSIRTFYKYGKDTNSIVKDTQFFNPKDYLVGLTSKIEIDITINNAPAEELGRIPFNLYLYYEYEGEFYEQAVYYEFVVLDKEKLPLIIDYRSLFFEQYDIKSPTKSDMSRNYYIYDYFGDTSFNVLTYEETNLTLGSLKISIEDFFFESTHHFTENEILLDIFDFECFDVLTSSKKLLMKIELSYQLYDEIYLAEYESDIFIFIYDKDFIKIEPFVVNLKDNEMNIFNFKDTRFKFDVEMLPLITGDPYFNYYYGFENLACDIKIDNLYVFQNYHQNGNYINIDFQLKEHNEFYLDFSKFSFREESYEKDVTFRLFDAEKPFIIKSTQTIKIVVIKTDEGLKIFNMKVPERGYFTPNDTLSFNIINQENYALERGYVELFDGYTSIVDKYEFIPRAGVNKVFDAFKEVKRSVRDFLRITIFGKNLNTNETKKVSYLSQVAFFHEGAPIQIKFTPPALNCFAGPSIAGLSEVKNFEFELIFDELLKNFEFDFVTENCYVLLQGNKYYFDVFAEDIEAMWDEVLAEDEYYKIIVSISMVYSRHWDEGRTRYKIKLNYVFDEFDCYNLKEGITNIQINSNEAFMVDIDLTEIENLYLNDFTFTFKITPYINNEFKDFNIIDFTGDAYLQFVDGSVILNEFSKPLTFINDNFEYTVSFEIEEEYPLGYAKFGVIVDYNTPSGQSKPTSKFTDIYALNENFPTVAGWHDITEQYIDFSALNLGDFHEDVKFSIYSLLSPAELDVNKFSVKWKFVGDIYNRVARITGNSLSLTNVPPGPEDPEWEGIYTYELEINHRFIDIDSSYDIKSILNNPTVLTPNFIYTVEYGKFFLRSLSQTLINKWDDPESLDYEIGIGCNSYLNYKNYYTNKDDFEFFIHNNKKGTGGERYVEFEVSVLSSTFEELMYANKKDEDRVEIIRDSTYTFSIFNDFIGDWTPVYSSYTDWSEIDYLINAFIRLKVMTYYGDSPPVECWSQKLYSFNYIRDLETIAKLSDDVVLGEDGLGITLDYQDSKVFDPFIPTGTTYYEGSIDFNDEDLGAYSSEGWLAGTGGNLDMEIVEAMGRPGYDEHYKVLKLNQWAGRNLERISSQNIEFWVMKTSGCDEFLLKIGYGGGWLEDYILTDIYNNEWHHIRLNYEIEETQDESYYEVYQNGVLEHEGVFPLSPSRFIDTIEFYYDGTGYYYLDAIDFSADDTYFIGRNEVPHVSTYLGTYKYESAVDLREYLIDPRITVQGDVSFFEGEDDGHEMILGLKPGADMAYSSVQYDFPTTEANLYDYVGMNFHPSKTGYMGQQISLVDDLGDKIEDSTMKFGFDHPIHEEMTHDYEYFFRAQTTGEYADGPYEHQTPDYYPHDSLFMDVLEHSTIGQEMNMLYNDLGEFGISQRNMARCTVAPDTTIFLNSEFYSKYLIELDRPFADYIENSGDTVVINIGGGYLWDLTRDTGDIPNPGSIWTIDNDWEFRLHLNTGTEDYDDAYLGSSSEDSGGELFGVTKQITQDHILTYGGKKYIQFSIHNKIDTEESDFPDDYEMVFRDHESENYIDFVQIEPNGIDIDGMMDEFSVGNIISEFSEDWHDIEYKWQDNYYNFYIDGKRYYQNSQPLPSGVTVGGILIEVYNPWDLGASDHIYIDGIGSSQEPEWERWQNKLAIRKKDVEIVITDDLTEERFETGFEPIFNEEVELFKITDLNDDDVNEVLIGSKDGRLTIFQKKEDSEDYERVWSSERFGYEIEDIQVFTPYENCPYPIISIMVNGKVYSYQYNEFPEEFFNMEPVEELNQMIDEVLNQEYDYDPYFFKGLDLEGIFIWENSLVIIGKANILLDFGYVHIVEFYYEDFTTIEKKTYTNLLIRSDYPVDDVEREAVFVFFDAFYQDQAGDLYAVFMQNFWTGVSSTFMKHIVKIDRHETQEDTLILNCITVDPIDSWSNLMQIPRSHEIQKMEKADLDFDNLDEFILLKGSGEIVTYYLDGWAGEFLFYDDTPSTSPDPPNNININAIDFQITDINRNGIREVVLIDQNNLISIYEVSNMLDFKLVNWKKKYFDDTICLILNEGEERKEREKTYAIAGTDNGLIIGGKFYYYMYEFSIIDNIFEFKYKNADTFDQHYELDKLIDSIVKDIKQAKIKISYEVPIKMKMGGMNFRFINSYNVDLLTKEGYFNIKTVLSNVGFIVPEDIIRVVITPNKYVGISHINFDEVASVYIGDIKVAEFIPRSGINDIIWDYGKFEDSVELELRVNIPFKYKFSDEIIYSKNINSTKLTSIYIPKPGEYFNPLIDIVLPEKGYYSESDINLDLNVVTYSPATTYDMVATITSEQWAGHVAQSPIISNNEHIDENINHIQIPFGDWASDAGFAMLDIQIDYKIAGENYFSFYTRKIPVLTGNQHIAIEVAEMNEFYSNNRPLKFTIFKKNFVDLYSGDFIIEKSVNPSDHVEPIEKNTASIAFVMGDDTMAEFGVLFEKDYCTSVYDSPITIDLKYEIFGGGERHLFKNIYGNFLRSDEPFIIGYDAPESGYYDNESYVPVKILGHPRVDFNISSFSIGEGEYLEILPEHTNPLGEFFKIPFEFYNYPDCVFADFDMTIVYFDKNNRMQMEPFNRKLAILHDEDNAFVIDIDVPKEGFFTRSDENINLYMIAIKDLEIQYFQIQVDNNYWINVELEDIKFYNSEDPEPMIIPVSFSSYDLTYDSEIKIKMNFEKDFIEFEDVRILHTAILNDEEKTMKINYQSPVLDFYSGKDLLSIILEGQTEKGLAFKTGMIIIEGHDPIEFAPKSGLNEILIDFSKYGKIDDAKIIIRVVYYIGDKEFGEEIEITTNLWPEGDLDMIRITALYVGAGSVIGLVILYKRMYYKRAGRRR